MFKKIFTTEGRLNRAVYSKYILCLSAASFVWNFVVELVAELLTGEPESDLSYILSAIVTLPLSVGAIMTGIRRLHDLNRSGWFMLVTLIPVLNLILVIYMLFFRGTEGANRYGKERILK